MPSEVNGEINDIYNELTNSLDKAGRTTPTANLPMGGFTLTGIGAPALGGSPVRLAAIIRGTDIAVTVSGTVTLPNEGSYFVLTGGAGLSVTGFANNFNGRVVTLKLPVGLVLVNSASLVLNGGNNRVAFAGDVIELVNESVGVWRELNYRYLLGKPKFSIYLSANAAAAAGGTTSIPFNTVEYDSHGIWDTVNSYTTAPVAGTYQIYLQVKMAVQTSLNSIQANILAGTTTNIANVPIISGNGAGTCVIQCQRKLAFGDSISFSLSTTGTGSPTILSGIGNSYATMQLIE